MTQQRSSNYATHADYAALRTQVSSISSEQATMRGQISHISENMVTKGELNSVITHLDNLATRIGESSRTNWGVIFAGLALAVTVFGGIWVSGIAPIEKNLITEVGRHDQTRTLLDQRWLIFTTRQAHEDFKHDMEREIDRIKNKSFTKDEWAAWKDERDRRLSAIERLMEKK